MLLIENYGGGPEIEINNNSDIYTKPIINLLCNKSTITKRRKSDSELSVSNLEEEIKENKNIIDEENLGKNENFIVKVNKKNTTNLEDKNMSDKLKKFLSNIK